MRGLTVQLVPHVHGARVRLTELMESNLGLQAGRSTCANPTAAKGGFHGTQVKSSSVMVLPCMIFIP